METTAFALEDILKRAVSENASDIHLAVGVPPILRINGKLIHIGDSDLTNEDCLGYARQLIGERLWAEYERTGECDTSYARIPLIETDVGCCHAGCRLRLEDHPRGTRKRDFLYDPRKILHHRKSDFGLELPRSDARCPGPGGGKPDGESDFLGGRARLYRMR